MLARSLEPGGVDRSRVRPIGPFYGRHEVRFKLPRERRGEFADVGHVESGIVVRIKRGCDDDAREYGWEQRTDWWYWFSVDGGNGPAITNARIFYYSPGIWVAAGVESFAATGTIDFHWIAPHSSTLGLTESVDGVFCKVTV